MIGRTIQWEGCATHLELELCCMDVFSGIFRQSCTTVSGTVDDDIIRTRLRKGICIKQKKREKSTVFLCFFTYKHICKRGTERPPEGPHIPLFQGSMILARTGRGHRWHYG